MRIPIVNLKPAVEAAAVEWKAYLEEPYMPESAVLEVADRIRTFYTRGL